LHLIASEYISSGALGTFDLDEATLRRLCPQLVELDARGRARKF